MTHGNIKRGKHDSEQSDDSKKIMRMDFENTFCTEYVRSTVH